MRVGIWTAGLLLTSAIAAQAAIVNLSPPPPSPPSSKTPTPLPPKAPTPVPVKAQAKVNCPCDCPKDRAASQRAQPRPTSRRASRRYAGNAYYNYGAAAPVIRQEWRAAPNDTALSGQEGVAMDDRGWTGGVGAAPDGGGGGGFVDGYGQVHFANGGSVENGPSYNSYGQSFQYNPSQAGPFQPRSMGGFAPPSR